MSSTQPTIVDIYCRVADGGPDAQTKLEQQEIACRDYCQEHGLSVGMAHYEVASGSTYRNRELLSLLRTRYHSGSIQGVVITRLERLSRSHAHLIILMQEMEAHHAVLHVVDENIVDLKFIRTMVAIITDVEREKALNPSLTERAL